ncbi:MAG: universal stress protein [Flavihumibacter sp.]
MTTILVPVDFSETSKNAARYASDMAKSINDTRLVFFHVFDPIAAGSDGTPLNISVADRKKIAEMAIENLSAEIGNTSPSTIIAREGTSLVDTVTDYVRGESCDLVVMGITGAGKLANILMGSNSLKMVKQVSVPVLIIPPNAWFSGLKTQAFATDVKDVKTTTPASQIRSFLDLFKPVLKIVHINADGSPVNPADEAQLAELLAPYGSPVQVVRNNDFLDGLDSFISREKVDCIITVPKQHGFLQGLFQPSHTRQLAHHTHIPILAIHE